MYLKHFQLDHLPFAERTPAQRLFCDPRMNEGLARLRYLVADGTIGLITGATGVGKSALVKRFIYELREPGYDTCYLHLTHLTSFGMLQQLIRRLGGQPQWNKEGLFAQLLERFKQAESPILIVLDESHLLTKASLIDIRLLVSSAIEEAPAVKFLLVGQEPLLETLRRSHRDLLDRITVRYPLYPYSKPESLGYINFQLQSANGSEQLFAEEVKELIHDHTGGVPRAINNLATASLLAGAGTQTDQIDLASFKRILSEFKLP